MNSIIPSNTNRKLRKSHVFRAFVVILAGSALTYVSRFALASNQPAVDTLSQLNTKIDVIEHSLMVNSQSWNDLEKNRLEIIAKQAYLETGNDSLREQEQKLTKEKEALIVGK